MKRTIAIVLSLILIAALVACSSGNAKIGSSQPAAPTDAPAASTNEPQKTEEKSAQAEDKKLAPEKPVYISAASGATGGTYHVVVAGMASLIDKYAENVSCTVITGTSGSENFKLVASDECQLGIGSGDTAMAAYAGTREFETALPNLRFLSSGYSSVMHIVVLDNSPIQSVEQLEGKRIASYPGSTTEAQVPAILAAYGLKPNENYTPMPMGIGDAADALRDGQVDAIMQFGGLPLSAITDLASTKGIRLLSISDEKLAQIQADNVWVSTATIPAGTYAGVDQDIQTAGQMILIYTNAETPDAVVYQMMEALMAHQDELTAIHPSAGLFNLSNGVNGAGTILPLHPAAEQYYKDHGALK